MTLYIPEPLVLPLAIVLIANTLALVIVRPTTIHRLGEVLRDATSIVTALLTVVVGFGLLCLRTYESWGPIPTVMIGVVLALALWRCSALFEIASSTGKEPAAHRRPANAVPKP